MTDVPRTITSAIRLDGSIRAVINGVETIVPAYPGNIEYDALMAWQAIPGNAIEEPSHFAPDLPAYAAQKRWEKEVGGLEINGLTVATDDRSKTMISGARVAAQNDANFTTDWKAADGTFVTIDAAAVIAISDAMLMHVSNCFAIEAQVLAAIKAGSITTRAQIDAAFAG
ncbi:DUF4376 domain-containing protein [Brucella intermedia]|uniref:DUF4376 domain-containing protein n=1 Tax=Brucella intermedia TaxID=94625 RepID=UPI00235E657B|nr:DUF4376 domain-containing protein [Brucella intermedia]